MAYRFVSNDGNPQMDALWFFMSPSKKKPLSSPIQFGSFCYCSPRMHHSKKESTQCYFKFLRPALQTEGGRQQSPNGAGQGKLGEWEVVSAVQGDKSSRVCGCVCVCVCVLVALVLDPFHGNGSA